MEGWNTYDTPLAVWVFVRKVEGDGEDVDVGKGFREPSTPVFDVGPVCDGGRVNGRVRRSRRYLERTMTVEPYTDLRRDIGQQESLVHCFLRGLCVCGGYPTQHRHPVHEAPRGKTYMCPRSYPLLK